MHARDGPCRRRPGWPDEDQGKHGGMRRGGLALRPTLAPAAVTAQEKWAAAYTHDVFTGGIQSAQRNESMNAFVKSHLTGMTSLEDLLGALDMVMVKEKHRAARTERELSRLTTMPAEATARSASRATPRPLW